MPQLPGPVSPVTLSAPKGPSHISIQNMRALRITNNKETAASSSLTL